MREKKVLSSGGRDGGGGHGGGWGAGGGVHGDIEIRWRSECWYVSEKSVSKQPLGKKIQCVHVSVYYHTNCLTNNKSKKIFLVKYVKYGTLSMFEM